MTCEEFWEILENTNPLEETRATIAAMIVHANICIECREKSSAMGAEADAELGSEIMDEIILMSKMINKRVDQDPEAAEMIRASKKQS